MPTIYDRYTIKWDGNSLSCDNVVVLGYNGKNTTILTFENTSLYEDVRFINVEFYGKGHTIVRSFENNAVETNLSPDQYGHDAIMSLYWERDSGDHGVSRMGVIIERSEYFHDEETEQQADTNTQEINRLKTRVLSLENAIHALREPVSPWNEGYQYDVGVSTQEVVLTKDTSPDLFERMNLDGGIGVTTIIAQGFAADVGQTGNWNLDIAMFTGGAAEGNFVAGCALDFNVSGTESPITAIRFTLDRVSGEITPHYQPNTDRDTVDKWLYNDGSAAYGGKPEPSKLAEVDTIRIAAPFDMNGMTFTFYANALAEV